MDIASKTSYSIRDTQLETFMGNAYSADTKCPNPKPFVNELAPTSGRAFSKEALEADNSIEVVVVGGGTNTYCSGSDFGYLTSAKVDQWR